MGKRHIFRLRPYSYLPSASFGVAFYGFSLCCLRRRSTIVLCHRLSAWHSRALCRLPPLAKKIHEPPPPLPQNPHILTVFRIHGSELQLNYTFICSKFKPNVRRIHFGPPPTHSPIRYVHNYCCNALRALIRMQYYGNMHSNWHFLIIMENSWVANHVDGGIFKFNVVRWMFLCSHRVCSFKFMVCWTDISCAQACSVRLVFFWVGHMWVFKAFSVITITRRFLDCEMDVLWPEKCETIFFGHAGILAGKQGKWRFPEAIPDSIPIRPFQQWWRGWIRTASF